MAGNLKAMDQNICSMMPKSIRKRYLGGNAVSEVDKEERYIGSNEYM